MFARLWIWLAARLAAPMLAAAEAEAHAARERLRDALEALPEGVVFLDADGRYILWNSRYAEIYHRSADLFRPGAKLEETLRIGVARGDYPDAIGREDAWIAERMARLAAGTGERHEQQVSDGRWLLIEDRRTSDGGMIGLRVDITDMKDQAAALKAALAHAEAANRAKAEFLADMSHEIRTPLNGILGLAQALDAAGLEPPQRELVGEIRTCAGQLDGLARELLDYGDADLVPAGESAGTRAPAAAESRNLRVLLADDNPINRKVIELMLAAAAVDVVSVENGALAVEAWRQDLFDLILMDLRMPVMDGLAAIAAIRAEEAGRGSERTSIVVVSANTSPEDRQASAEAGADGHIGKPVQVDQLLGAIEAAIAG